MEGRALGPYRIEKELGSGGMGTVYLAIVEEETPPLKPGDRVAVKVVHSHLLSKRGFFKRFLREAEVGKRVRHENVVGTLDMDALEVEGQTALYLAMEYVEGRTLREMLVDLRTVPEALLREIARQVVAGLAAIHEAGIVHRDMKPENILITEDHQVRIMDLGVARLVDESVAVTREGEFAGSLLYAAPEQFGPGEVGPPADLYSLGVVLYELATGDNPFRRDLASQVIAAHLNETPRTAFEANSEVSPFLAEVVATLLQKEPEDRIGSAATLGALLEEGESSRWWAERKQVAKEQRGHLPRIHVRQETALYGREGELDALREVWKEAVAGRGSTILLEGEMGIGKSRLANEFLADLEGQDVRVLYGSYPPSGGMGGLSDAIIDHFGATGLAAALAPYLTETPALVPAFAAMVRHETPPAGSETVVGEALQAVVCHLARGLAKEKPLLWIADDLHYAHPDSRGMILALARAIAEHRVLLLGTTEPGLPDDELTHFSRLPNFRRLPLNRLSPRQVIEVLRDAFRSEALAEKLGGRIAYKSDGVPFFVFEMVRGLKDGQFLKQLPDGSYVQTQVIEEIEVPSAVRDLVEGRLGDLAKDERALLDIGAVMGAEFDPDLVARVREAKRVHVLETLADLERHSGVVRAAGRSCQFDHHQIQEVVYSALPDWLREEYHALIADAFADREGLAGTDPEDLRGEPAIFLARHYLEGSRPSDARSFLDPALTHLERTFRHEEALLLADRALGVEGLVEGVARVDLLLRKAERLSLTGRSEESRSAFELALRIADETEDPLRRARVRGQMGYQLLTTDAEGALPVLQEAVDLAREAGDIREEQRSEGALASAYWSLGDYDRMEEHEARAAALLEDAGDRRAQAKSANRQGILAWSRGRTAKAREQYERALAIAEEVGDRSLQATLSMNVGIALHEEGRWEEALGKLERAEEEFRATGLRGAESNVSANLASILSGLGRHEQALDKLKKGLTTNREIGNRRGEGYSQLLLAAEYLRLGRSAEAGEAVDTGSTIAEEVGDRLRHGYTHLLRGQLAEHEGRPGDALRHLKEGLEVMRKMGFPRGVADASLSIGRALLRSDTPEDSRPHLEEALTLGRELDRSEAVALSSLMLALLPGGDVDGALETFEEQESRLESAAKTEARFLLFELTGDTAQLEDAWQLLSYGRDHAPEEDRESMIERVPIHRGIAEAWKEHGRAGPTSSPPRP